MSSDNRRQVVFRMDEATVDRAKQKLEHGEMSERLRQTLTAIAHGADAGERERVKGRLQDARQERDELKSEIDTKQQQLQTKTREIERLEERLDALMDKESEYDGFLQGIEQDMVDGMHVFHGHAKIERAAELGGCSQQDVLDDLRERNPSLPAQQFERGSRVE